VVLTEWIRENESVVQALLDDATATFDGISLDDLEAVFEMAWNDGEIGEGELVAAAVRQQAEAYEKVRDLLGGEKTRGAVAVGIRRSPGRATGLTDDGISWETVLGSSRLPSIQRVRQLIEEAKNERIDDDAKLPTQAKLPTPTTTRGQNDQAAVGASERRRDR